jgi:hypothetical protein
MVTKFILIFVLLATMLMGCNLASPALVTTPIPTDAPTLAFSQPTPVPPASPTSAPTMPPSATPVSPQQTALERAAEVIGILKDQDMVILSQYIHPQMGLRFSPYAYVKDTDQVFPADKISGLIADSTVYTWGVYDGSGEPIDLTFAYYYSKFVYDVDFANAPQVALNHRLGVGNSIDNSQEFYPGAMIVEYYFPGFDPQYAGMDWRSLRLVFMEENNIWYLVGIIHDQWTI